MLKYRENENFSKRHNFWPVQAKCIKFRSRVELVVAHKLVDQKFKNNGIQDGGAANLKFFHKILIVASSCHLAYDGVLQNVIFQNPRWPPTKWRILL